MSNTAWWYLARSSGLVAWLFLVATLVLGALASGRLVERRGGRRWLLDLHPYLAGLSVLLVVLHVVSIIADHTISFSWVDAFVPFASHWRPGAIAWAVVGVWILIAVQITSLARKHLPRRIWHGIHLSSYVLAVVTTVHALMSGTDVGRAPVAFGMAAVVSAALFTSLWRFDRPAPGPRPAAVSARMAPPRG